VILGFVTDQGGSNKKNEDSVLVDVEKGLFIVADGLGGHNAGKCASSIATEEIAVYLNKNLASDKQDPLPVLEQAVMNANYSIIRSAEADPEWCTVSDNSK
jgi:PPM family protein phosphatase